MVLLSSSSFSIAVYHFQLRPLWCFQHGRIVHHFGGLAVLDALTFSNKMMSNLVASNALQAASPKCPCSEATVENGLKFYGKIKVFLSNDISVGILCLSV
ncbi:hypothetical protein L6164_020162 [Bauhinia variegata]|uniref:Uncharacterized protein n=1 Tax=Bauhinia variegata TaxID=167791 RepID=A0ACB9MVT9_BAUVA|nr:hypothetical protein L6164_020162 [Bauhinia variegata]